MEVHKARTIQANSDRTGQVRRGLIQLSSKLNALSSNSVLWETINVDQTLGQIDLDGFFVDGCKDMTYQRDIDYMIKRRGEANREIDVGEGEEADQPDCRV